MKIARLILAAYLMTIERAIFVHVSAGEPSDSNHNRDPITIEIGTKIRCFQRLHVSHLGRPSDGDQTIQCVHAVLPDCEITKDRDRLMKPCPMKPDEIATKIGHSWRLHLSSGKPIDRRHFSPILRMC